MEDIYVIIIIMFLYFIQLQLSPILLRLQEIGLSQKEFKKLKETRDENKKIYTWWSYVILGIIILIVLFVLAYYYKIIV